MVALRTFRPHQSRWLQGVVRITRLQNLVILGMTQYFTAYFLVGVHESRRAYLTDVRLGLLVTSTVLIAAAGYIINDYYDVKIDLINRPRQVVIGTVLKRRIALASHVLLSTVGIAVGFYLSRKVGAIHLGSVFLLWLYSNQLKRFPLVGNLSVALLSGLAIAVIAIDYQQEQFLVFTYALFAFAVSLIREIIKDLEDQRGDETFGCKTLPVVLGVRRTKDVLYGLSGFFIFIMFFMAGQLGNHTLVAYFALLVIPIAYFITKLVYADTQDDFTYLSNFCKLLMLSGIISMIFF